MYADKAITNINYGDHNQLGADPYGESKILYDNHTHAKLFLFSPKRLANEARRTHQYNLDSDRFVGELSDKLDQVRERRSSASSESFMLDVPSADNAVTLSAESELINMEPFSMYWTFVLIVDNDPISDRNGVLRPKMMGANRVLYTGICLDEPCNPVSIDGRTSINTNALLQITHITYMRVQKQVDAQGTHILANITHDRDIIFPDYVSQSTYDNSSDQVMVDPKHMKRAIHLEGDEMMYSPSNSYLHNLGSLRDPGTDEVTHVPIQLETDIKSPRIHLQKLMQPLFAETSNLSSSLVLGNNAGMNPIHTPRVYNSDALVNNFNQSAETYYNSHTPNIQIGLSTDSPVSITELLRTYPDLYVQPFNTPFELPVDPVNPGELSPQAIAESMVTSALPTIMIRHGLSNLAFDYTSTKGFNISGFNDGGDLQGKFTLNSISSMVPETQQITTMRWDEFTKTFETHMVNALRNILDGEFGLIVSSQGIGACYVSIIKLDQMYGREPDRVVSTNNLYSSLTSPLIGKEHHLSHNANMFASLSPQLSSMFNGW